MRAIGQQRRLIVNWATPARNLQENKEISMKTFLVLCVALTLLVGIAVIGAKANAAEDRKTVAALDTQYQAAVEKNDAATMDRILADDFVVVLGSGKSYTKADLLNEARSGRTIYERQGDTEQTVRLWGD